MTGIAFAAASVSVLSWQTLQLVMYVGYVTENFVSALNSYSPVGMLCELWMPCTRPTKLSGIQVYRLPVWHTTHSEATIDP